MELLFSADNVIKTVGTFHARVAERQTATRQQPEIDRLLREVIDRLVEVSDLSEDAWEEVAEGRAPEPVPGTPEEARELATRWRNRGRCEIKRAEALEHLAAQIESAGGLASKV